MKALGPELQSPNPSSAILPPSRGHTRHTVLRAFVRSGSTRAPDQGLRKGDSPAGLWGGYTSGGAGQRYHRTPYLVTEASSLQDPLRSPSASSSPREEGDNPNQYGSTLGGHGGQTRGSLGYLPGKQALQTSCVYGGGIVT